MLDQVRPHETVDPEVVERIRGFPVFYPLPAVFEPQVGSLEHFVEHAYEESHLAEFLLSLYEESVREERIKHFADLEVRLSVIAVFVLKEGGPASKPLGYSGGGVIHAFRCSVRKTSGATFLIREISGFLN